MISRNYGEVPTLETRHEANEKVDRAKRYKQILACLSQGPLTAKEVAVCMANRGWIPNSDRNYAAPRLTELSKAGKVEPIGKARCTYTRKTVTVYRLMEA